MSPHAAQGNPAPSARRASVPPVSAVEQRSAPVYATRQAAEQAAALGIRSIETEVARRRSELTRYGPEGRTPGRRWLEGPTWRAEVVRSHARVREGSAWLVTEVTAK